MRLPPALRLTRPGNALVAGVGAYVGSVLVAPTLVPSSATLLAALAAVCFAAAGNVRNDVTDVEVDRVAHPARPLVTGAVSRRTATFLAVVLYLVAVECAALVSLSALLLVVVALALMEAYERGLKHEGLPGNVVVGALTAAPFLVGAMAAARSWGGAPWLAAWPEPAMSRPALLAVALLAALATIGREVLKDVEDEAADAELGKRRTLPMRVGRLGAVAASATFLLVAVLLSPLPWRLERVLAWPYLPAVAVADALFLGAAIAGARRRGGAAMGQRLAKLGMVAALIALLLGRALAAGRAA